MEKDFYTCSLCADYFLTKREMHTVNPPVCRKCHEYERSLTDTAYENISLEGFFNSLNSYNKEDVWF